MILRRGSTRQFSRDAITHSQLSTILDKALRGMPADFLGGGEKSLPEAYLIVNDVVNPPPGAYVFHRHRQALEMLREERFRRAAGHLGLDQALSASASVGLFFLADLKAVLAGLGNRGYRAAQLDAGVAAGRVYLAAYALPHPIGATGLTFFDDAVTEFFSLHAEGKSAMFLIAVGNKAPRR